MHYRQALVDIFIGRIELFGDHMIIYYNAHDGQKTNIPIDSLPNATRKINEYGEIEAIGLVRPNKYFSNTEIAEMAAGYNAGKTTYDLAIEHGCSRTTVSKTLKKHRVNVTKRKANKKLNVADVVTTYAEQHTTQEIAAKYKVCPQVVVKCLRTEGVEIRGRWG